MKRPLTLRAIQPNAGIRAKYQKRMRALIDRMLADYARELLRIYKRNPPRIAQDETPSKELERALKGLSRRWRTSFRDMSGDLAEFFARDVERQTSSALPALMKKHGWTVPMKMTGEMRDVLNATIAENVSLIRSIPEQFHTQVEGLVMRSVVAGRDLRTLTVELEKRFAITRARAELIAIDQNNKATNQLARVRQIGMGVEEGIWMHSAAGKKPRPTHVKNNGKRFSLRTGWYDPAVKRWILPGELIRCRCTFRPVIKGFS